MIKSLCNKLFSRIVPTAEYESSVVNMENNCKKLTEILNSDNYKQFLELKSYVESGKCKNDIDTVKNLKFKKSPEFETERKLKILSKNEDVKKHIKSGENAESVKVIEYYKIKDEVKSAEFIAKKSYLCDKKKHEKTEAYKKLNEYNALKSLPDIKMLPELQKKCLKYIDEKNKWECIFEEDFVSETFDKNWITKPLSGEKFLDSSYSAEGELQLTTDAKNVDVSGGIMKIITKKEDAEGLKWTEKFGFVPNKFKYTSGIAGTATKFYVLRGKVETKIRMPKNRGICSLFLLSDDEHQNVIKVFSVNKGKFSVGFLKDKNIVGKKKIGVLRDDFYIVSVDFSSSEIVWTINGKKVYSSNVQMDKQMHLLFHSGVTHAPNPMQLPASVDVAWVKCYNEK